MHLIVVVVWPTGGGKVGGRMLSFKDVKFDIDMLKGEEKNENITFNFFAPTVKGSF